FFPFLFVTVACGAISGFHSLVASGTTSKQLAKESDARYVGYMGALGEGSLALGAILATTAGIAAVGLDWGTQYSDFGTAAGGAVGNFVQGIAGFASHLGVPVELGTIFAAVVVISFAATTMDTGVRLQRYIIQEIGDMVPEERGGVAGAFRTSTRNLTAVTALAVIVPLGLALAPAGGDAEAQGFAFGRLWTLFGTTNQLTAGLALAVVAVYVTKQGRNALAQIIPLVFLLIMTTWALLLNLADFVREGDWLLAPLDLIILVLAAWLIFEAGSAILRARSEQHEQVTDQDRTR
ncbi:MAG: carbon starvation CstA 5TM domain-containing protein, partial [Trueperaceae bacterium]